MARTARMAALLAAIALSPGALAQVAAAPAIVNFQGRLTSPTGAPVADGTNYTVTVSLWDAATSGTQKWSQTLNNVAVKDGVFSALLTPNTAGLFNGANLWLQVQVGSDPAMTPRQRIASVPFALKANAVPDASIGSAQLAPDAASLAKVSNSLLSASGTTVTIPGNRTLEFGGGVTKETNAGKISYERFTPDALDIVGAGTEPDNRKVKFFAEGGATFTGGAAFAGAVTTSGALGVGTATPSQKLDVRNGNVVLTTAGGQPRAYVAINDGVDAGYMQILNSAGKVIAGFGGDNSGGQAFVTDGSGSPTVLLHPDGRIEAHGMSLNGPIKMYDAALNNTITLDPSGEITAKIVSVTGGSDVAEPYRVAAAGGVAPRPGMVVAMDPDHVGQMKVATRAYDPAVGGILSGANGIAPGITLRQKGTVADGEFPVASVGRVWCYADADANGPITTGTLLTTSDTPGYAMRATDAARASGCIIGKSMSSLATGKGLVLVLVSLK